MRQLCECGCRREVAKEGNRFIHGHYWRGKKGRVSWNKGKKTGPQSSEAIAKRAAAMKGKKPWNKGKTHTDEAKAKIGTSHTYSLKDWQEKCPLLSKMEEMKEEDGKIWAHCVNHNCPNSKEKGGWFIPDGRQLPHRIDALNDGDDNNCFYCSDQCKKTCIKFHKSAASLIIQDEIVAGIQKEPLYTSEEYDTWREEVFRRQKEELGSYNECEYCGNRNVNELSAHHEKPQKTHPGMSLDPDNGIILCGATSKNKCHYKIGHRAGTDCSTGALATKICI